MTAQATVNTVKKDPAIVLSLKAVYATEADMDKAIQAVAKKSATLQEDIQKVAVGIMAHAYHHGDYTRAMSLVTALGEGVRKKALIEWFNKAGLEVDDVNGGFKGWQGKGFIEKHWERITGTKWYDCKPENIWAGFNLKAELERLIKKAEGANKKAEQLRQSGKEVAEDAVQIDVETLSKLRAMV